MKQVLILSQVIPQWYVDTLTQALGEDVHVDIITGSQVKGNVIPSPVHDPRSLKSRLICWTRHYTFLRRWMRQNRDRHYDLIFAVSNPPINSRVGLELKKKFHAPFLYMNWDLYPQVVETSIHNPAVQAVCRLWHGWNSRNYPKIDRMLTIGSVMAQSMTAPMKEKIPVEVVPIAADVDRLQPIAREDNPFCRENGLTDKFVVLYSGKMGLGHNIELILAAAEKLRKYPDIRFVFIGEGQKYPLVEAYVREHRDSNVMLFPFQPEETFHLSMACGDVGVISQEASMAHLFMPSKTYSMMACGEAILGICTERDDLHSLLTSSEIGTAVTDNDPDTLAEAVLELYRNREKLQQYQKNARQLAEDRFSMDKIRQQYKDIFGQFLR